MTRTTHSPRVLMNHELYGSVPDRCEKVRDMLVMRFAGEATVRELAFATGMPGSVVGSTLGTMARDGLVRRDGSRWLAVSS